MSRFIFLNRTKEDRTESVSLEAHKISNLINWASAIRETGWLLWRGWSWAHALRNGPLIHHRSDWMEAMFSTLRSSAVGEAEEATAMTGLRGTILSLPFLHKCQSVEQAEVVRVRRSSGGRTNGTKFAVPANGSWHTLRREMTFTDLMRAPLYYSVQLP